MASTKSIPQQSPKETSEKEEMQKIIERLDRIEKSLSLITGFLYQSDFTINEAE